jgi:hypothetical protein
MWPRGTNGTVASIFVWWLFWQDMVLLLFKWRIKYSPADILVLSAGNCCGLRQFYYVKYHWLRDQLPGKVLCVNAESTGDQTGNQATWYRRKPSMNETYKSHLPPWPLLACCHNTCGQFSRGRIISVLAIPAITCHLPASSQYRRSLVIYLTPNCVNYRQKAALPLCQIGMVYHGHCVPIVDNNDNNGNIKSNFSRLPSDFVGGLAWTHNLDVVVSNIRYGSWWDWKTTRINKVPNKWTWTMGHAALNLFQWMSFLSYWHCIRRILLRNPKKGTKWKEEIE